MRFTYISRSCSARLNPPTSNVLTSLPDPSYAQLTEASNPERLIRKCSNQWVALYMRKWAAARSYPLLEALCGRERSGSPQPKSRAHFARELCTKEKADHIHDRPLFMPATTYSPPHFRVQYNRPSGA